MIIDCLVKIGSIIYGLATAGMLVLGIYVAKKTVPNELKKWRTQQYDAKKAEVAAKILVALSAYLPAITYLGARFHNAEPISKPTPTKPADPDAKVKDSTTATYDRYEAKIAQLQPEINDLKAAMIQGEIYFDAPIPELLRDCWEVFVNMRSDHDAYIRGLRNLGHLMTVQGAELNDHYAAFDGAYGGYRGQLEKAAAELRKQLTPHARLKD